MAGDQRAGATPVPIPNSAVKPCSVDGTAIARSWESRPSSASLIETPSVTVVADGVLSMAGAHSSYWGVSVYLNCPLPKVNPGEMNNSDLETGVRG